MLLGVSIVVSNNFYVLIVCVCVAGICVGEHSADGIQKMDSGTLGLKLQVVLSLLT